MYNSNVLDTLTNAASQQNSSTTLPNETCETSLAALRIFEALLYRIASQIQHENDEMNYDSNNDDTTKTTANQQQQKDAENTTENSDKTICSENDNYVYPDTGIPHVDLDVMTKCIETLLSH